MEINNTFSPIDIAGSGMKAQAKSMETISSNIANYRTTDAGSGQPYRRLEAIFKTDDEGGVSIDKILTDNSPLPKIYDPAHPAANSEGYVTMPNVDIPKEMMNMTIATRAYQASAATLKRYQNMVNTTLELLK